VRERVASRRLRWVGDPDALALGDEADQDPAPPAPATCESEIERQKDSFSARSLGYDIPA
jgi:hypothetical protein